MRLQSIIQYMHTHLYLVIGIAVAFCFLLCFVLAIILRGNKSKKMGEKNAEKSSGASTMDNGTFRIEIGNVQGTGERDEQQDAFGFSPNSKWKDKGFLAILCDGMGGMDSGAAISNKLVADIIKEFPYSFDELKDGWILEDLTSDIFQEYRGRGGTTLIITFLQGDKLWFASVGDSDLLLLRNGRIFSMNYRQEYGNHLLMKVVDGQLGLEQVQGNSDAPALTEFMGAQRVEADYSVIPWQVKDGDVYLLCSDGVTDTLNFDEVRDCMMHSPSECAELLEKGIMGKNKKFQDNYTAIVFAVHDIGGTK